MSCPHPSLVVAMAGSGPGMNLARLVGRMFSTQSLAASCPLEVVPSSRGPWAVSSGRPEPVLVQ